MGSPAASLNQVCVGDAFRRSSAAPGSDVSAMASAATALDLDGAEVPPSQCLALRSTLVWAMTRV